MQSHLYIIIYNVFLCVTTMVNLCYNLYCVKIMADLKCRELHIVLEFKHNSFNGYNNFSVGLSKPKGDFQV